MKRTGKLFFLLIIISSCIIFGTFLWFNRSALNIPEEGIEFQIRKGDTVHSISERLYLENYIKSKELFVILSKLIRLDKSLKTGWIFIKENSTTSDIIKDIYSEKFITVTFTIPEGSTIRQIKRTLIEQNIVDENDLDDFFSNPDYPSLIGLDGFKTAEGFLFPDTYVFFKGIDTSTVLSAMVKLFFKKLEEIYPYYKSLSRMDLYDKIILASIIEREVKVPEEYPIVAGIFYNRINRGMRLQSCATVQYVFDKPREQLFDIDLEIDSPYNTYIHNGLPPGPISNPGYIALKAAFYPDKNDYLFFVVKDPERGTHHFSRTFREHIIAQKKYKSIKGFY